MTWEAERPARSRIADEVNDALNFRTFTKQASRIFDPFIKRPLFGEDQAIGCSQIMDRITRKFPTFESHKIETSQKTMIVGHTEWDHIANNGRAAPYKRKIPNPALLVQGRQAAHDDIVANDRSPAERRIVGKHDVVAVWESSAMSVQR